MSVRICRRRGRNSDACIIYSCWGIGSCRLYGKPCTSAVCNESRSSGAVVLTHTIVGTSPPNIQEIEITVEPRCRYPIYRTDRAHLLFQLVLSSLKTLPALSSVSTSLLDGLDAGQEGFGDSRAVKVGRRWHPLCTIVGYHVVALRYTSTPSDRTTTTNLRRCGMSPLLTTYPLRAISSLLSETLMVLIGGSSSESKPLSYLHPYFQVSSEGRQFKISASATKIVASLEAICYGHTVVRARRAQGYAIVQS